MGDKIFTLAIAVFGLVFLIIGRDYSSAKQLYVSSASFPTFISALLIICAIGLFIRQVVESRKAKETDEASKIGNITGKGALVIVAMFIFSFSLSYLGFFIAGTLITILFAYMLQTGKRKVYDTFIYPIIVLLVVIFFFKQLKIYLPSSSLFGL